MSKNEKHVSTDIYERLEAEAQGKSGSVQDDLDQFNGNIYEMEEYFGDRDPAEFL